MFGRQRVKDAGWQTACFRTKHQIIPVLIAYRAMRWRTFGGQSKQALRMFCGDEGGVIRVAQHGGKFMVIQPRATQALVVPGKAHWLYNMQTKAGVGAKTDNIAGIWRDFWFE